MDKVRFSCPRCRTMMQTGIDKIGYDVACPHCAHRFRLVDSPPATVPSHDDVTMPPSNSPVGQPGASYSNEQPEVVAPFVAEVKPSVGMSAPSDYIRQSHFTCPYCHTSALPIEKTEVSTVGWVVFTVLLITTCVGCVVGLFIRERYRICSQCRIRLG